MIGVTGPPLVRLKTIAVEARSNSAYKPITRSTITVAKASMRRPGCSRATKNALSRSPPTAPSETNVSR